MEKCIQHVFMMLPFPPPFRMQSESERESEEMRESGQNETHESLSCIRNFTFLFTT